MVERPELAAGGTLLVRCGVRDGYPRLLEQRQTAPLKVARALPFEIGQRPGLEIRVMEAAPGLLAGDQYRFDWHLERDVMVRMTTQGATRAHPARGNPASIGTRLVLESGAVLFYLPEATVLYRDAELRTDTEVELAPGALLVHLEVVAAGRIARGEAFEFASWESRFNARSGGDWLSCGRQRCVPAELCPTHPGAWSHDTHWGLMYALGDEVDGKWLAAARRELPMEEGELGMVTERGASDGRCAASRVPGGIAVALLGKSAYGLRQHAMRVVGAWERLLTGAGC